MTVPKTLPAPRRNLTQAGLMSRYSGVASTDIAVAAGDYTGGASEDLFTLTSHGFSDGDVVYVVSQSAQGGVTGGPGTRAYVNSLSSSTFQLCSDSALATTIENTADATVVFLKGNGVPQRVADAIRSLMIVTTHDFTGGTVEDMEIPYLGTDIGEADQVKLLYESAAGVAGTVDTTYYVKAPVAGAAAFYFQLAATAGGSVLDTTADGTAVFIKTS